MTPPASPTSPSYACSGCPPRRSTSPPGPSPPSARCGRRSPSRSASPEPSGQSPAPSRPRSSRSSTASHAALLELDLLDLTRTHRPGLAIRSFAWIPVISSTQTVWTPGSPRSSRGRLVAVTHVLYLLGKRLGILGGFTSTDSGGAEFGTFKIRSDVEERSRTIPRDHFLGQLGRGPVRHRPARILRGFTRHRDDPGDLLGGERARTPGPGFITQDILDRPAKRRRGSRSTRCG